MVALLDTTSANTYSHMMYLPSRDVWIEVQPLPDLYGLGPMLQFRNGRDAAAWLLEPEEG